MGLKCPECACSLRVIVDGQVEIDACDQCFGIWLDADEFDKLTAVTDLRTHFATEGQSESHHCPRCTSQYLTYMVNSDHLIQVCLRCDGIFMSGELLQRYKNEGRHGVGKVEVDQSAASDCFGPWATGDLLYLIAEVAAGFIP